MSKRDAKARSKSSNSKPKHGKFFSIKETKNEINVYSLKSMQQQI